MLQINAKNNIYILLLFYFKQLNNVIKMNIFSYCTHPTRVILSLLQTGEESVLYELVIMSDIV